MEFRKQVTRHKTTFKIPQENYTSKKQTHTHTNAHCNNKLKTEKKTIRMLEMDDASAVNYPNEKVLVYLKKSLVF